MAFFVGFCNPLLGIETPGFSRLSRKSGRFGHRHKIFLKIFGGTGVGRDLQVEWLATMDLC